MDPYDEELDKRERELEKRLQVLRTREQEIKKGEQAFSSNAEKQTVTKPREVSSEQANSTGNVCPRLIFI